eukprot:TRINITY_DN67478_c3_g2_i3.p1 TRINITY_DN67478_c3_g2~~TRINITY_DN67478_c3_g2_i3.p1  ORF type:complete len:324 (+),score=10.08 TRINITY_DN67478_c3_g2_i3:114-1085(+)
MFRLLLLSVMVATSLCLSDGWTQLFRLPEARKFSIALQEYLAGNPAGDHGAITLFIPEDPDTQHLLASEDWVKNVMVKGAYSSRHLAWAHMPTLAYSETPVLWGRPQQSYGTLSTIKVAGDYYVVFGENDERKHIKISQVDVINTPDLVVHFTKMAATPGRWQPWGPAGACSATCGTGTVPTTRSCTPGFVCFGKSEGTMSCNAAIPCRTGARFSQIEPSTSCWGYSTPTIWVDERGEYLPICATTNGLNDGIMTLAPAICAALSCEPSVRNWGTTPLANVAAYGLDFVEMPSCTSNSDPETCTPGAVVTCNLSTIGLVNCIS